MQRVTISMPDPFADELERFMAVRGYRNRSEALRDLVRHGLDQARLADGQAVHAVAALTYVFNHHQRELAKRLTATHHRHHELGLATMHVHLDHDHCLEVVVLRGAARAIQELAQGILAERGVQHGHVAFVPVALATDDHAHRPGQAPAPHGHYHPSP